MISKSYKENGKIQFAEKNQEAIFLNAKQYLEGWLEENDYLDGEDVNENISFAELGLSSIDAVGLVEDIQDELGIKLDSTSAWKYPNVNKLSKYIAQLKFDLEPKPELVNDENKNFSINDADNETDINLESMDLNSLALELEKLLSRGNKNINLDERI